MKGLYAFHKPTNVTDFDLRAMTTGMIWASKKTNIVPGPINPPSGWLLVAIQQVETSSNVFAGADFELTIDWNVEYSTTSPWLSTLPSPLPYEDLQRAIHELGPFQSCHENPLHMTDITRFLKRVGNVALQYGPAIVKGLAVVNPAFKPIADLLQ